MKKNILIYNESFFSLSETFIYHYVLGAAEHFNVHLLSHKIENRDLFPLPVNVFDHELLSKRDPFLKIRPVLQKVINKDKTKIPLKYRIIIQSLIRNTPIDLIHAHYGQNGLAILPYARKYNIPLIITFHGYDASRAINSQKYLSDVKNMFEYASAVVIVSPHMIDNLNLEPYSEKVHIIPCGVDADVFLPKNTHEKDTVDILHAGRLVEKKGVPDLIKVFQRLERKYSNLKLHIVGAGPQYKVCWDLVSTFRISSEKVKFYGAQPHSEVKRLMEQADIYVLNSRMADDGNMEGLPVTILEAMSMQKAIVSTLHAGIPLAITSEKDGILVPEKDNDALEKAIERLYLDKKLRTQLGESARQKVIMNFTVKIMQSKINTVYQSILSR
jgi:colanic acid/amylovoran biosynthesis glycosyltransferase